MVQKLLLVCLLMVCQVNIQAQKTCNIWCFGKQVGLDFNYSPPKPFAGVNLNTAEGCSSIADSNGQLLFYTNGTVIWNKNHDTMFNGTGLYGDNSSTQSALIIRKPGSQTLYYVFTTDAYFKSTIYHGVSYSIVDLSKGNGLGQVIQKNKQLFPKSNEKIAATLHENGQAIWLVSPKRNTDSLYSYLLDTNGLNGPFYFKNQGCYLGLNNLLDAGIGQMKFSGKGHLAYINAIDSSKIHVLNFNHLTGQFSQSKTILHVPASPYGLEFSENGRNLFVSVSNAVYSIQFNGIYDGVEFDSCALLLYQQANYSKPFGALQLGPDANIYLASYNSPFLSVIEYVNDSLPIFKFNAVGLGNGLSQFGLPEFVQNDIYKPIDIIIPAACNGSNVTFQISHYKADSVKWDFGDGRSIVKNGPKINHVYLDSGSFNVIAYLYLNQSVDTIIKRSIYVHYIKSKTLKDSNFCMGDTFNYNINEKTINCFWSNGDTSHYFRSTVTGIYWVKLSNASCERIDTFKLTFLDKPDLYIGKDTIYCHSFNRTFKVGNQYKKYLWSTGDTIHFINVSQAGKYTITVKDSNACIASDTIDITEIEKPSIALQLDTVLCQFVHVRAFSNFKNSIYKWSTGDTSANISVTQKGIYSLRTQISDCVFWDTIHVNTLPKPDFTLGRDTIVCSTLQFKAPIIGQYLWNNLMTTSTYNVRHSEFVVLKITSNNCSAYDTIYVQFCDDVHVYIPNAFSPNKDNVNDVFEVKGFGIDSVYMQIFNRWGEIIYKGNIWNGTYQNEICMPGVYYYSIELTLHGNKNAIYKGGISLMY